MKVAFIGLNDFESKPLLAKAIGDKIEDILEELITQNRAKKFIFGKLGHFVNICYITVKKLKKKYPRIRRAYISVFVKPDKEGRKILKRHFERVEYPLREYFENMEANNMRNELIVDACDILVVYYDKELPEIQTQYAYNYAMEKGKKIINIFDEIGAKYFKF